MGSWTENELLTDLAWNVRPVPQCCCSPHIPHLVQDKMILIQNGRIVNRQFIDDLDELHKALPDAQQRMAVPSEPNSDQKEPYIPSPSPSPIPHQNADTMNNTN